MGSLTIDNNDTY